MFEGQALRYKGNKEMEKLVAAANDVLGVFLALLKKFFAI